MSWPFFVRHYDDHAQQAAGRASSGPSRAASSTRASGTLGGCTAHNAMITVYPHDADWDGIAARHRRPELAGDARCAGGSSGSRRCPTSAVRGCCPGNPWLARLLAALPFVSDKYVNRSRHGFDGWLHTTPRRPRARARRHAGASRSCSSPPRRAAWRDFLRRAARPRSRGSSQRRRPQRLAVAGRRCREGLWLIPIAVRAGPAQRCPGADPGRRSAPSRPAATCAPARWSPGCCSTTRGRRPGRRRRRVPRPAARLPGRPGRRRRRPDRSRSHGAGPPRGDPRRRRLQHPAAAEALRHRARGRELERFGIRVPPSTCRASGRTCRTATRSASSPRCARTSRCWSGADVPAAGATARTRDPGYRRVAATAAGVYTTNGALLGIIRRSRPELADPDLFIFGLPAKFTGYYPGYSAGPGPADATCSPGRSSRRTPCNRAAACGCGRRTRATPRDIRFRYFDEGDDTAGEDLDAVVTGIEVARSIMNRPRATTSPSRAACPGRTWTTREELRPFVARRGLGPPRLVHLPRSAAPTTRGPSSAATSAVHGDARGCGSSTPRSSRASPASSSSPRSTWSAEKASAAILADAAPPRPPSPSDCGTSSPLPPAQARPRDRPGDPMSTETQGRSRVRSSATLRRHPTAAPAPSVPARLPADVVLAVYDWSRSVDHRAAGTSCRCPPALAVLVGVRTILRQKNLYDPSTGCRSSDVPQRAAVRREAPVTAATRRHLQRPRPSRRWAVAGARFGRNIPLDQVLPVTRRAADGRPARARSAGGC